MRSYTTLIIAFNTTVTFQQTKKNGSVDVDRCMHYQTLVLYKLPQTMEGRKC
jgi:hypothetical protein